MTEYIELSICMNGETLSVREDLPPLLKISSGPMSCTSALCGSMDRLTQRMGELVARGQQDRSVFVAWRAS